MVPWTPASSASGAWSKEGALPLRVFSPYVFSLAPIFDTGTTQGVWSAATSVSAVWTPE